MSNTTVHNKKKAFALSLVNLLIDLLWLPSKIISKRVDPTVINPEKILVVRLDHIGDIVMTTPAFTLLKQRFPDSKMYLLCSLANQQLFQGDNRFEKTFAFNWPWDRQAKVKWSTAKIKELLKLISLIRKEKIDLFIDFRGDLRFVVLFGLLTGIDVRLSNSRTGNKNLLTFRADYDVEKHEVKKCLDIIGPFVKPKTELFPSLFINENDQADIRLLLINNGIMPANKMALVAPYSSKDIKSWPDDYFRKIISFLIKNDYQVLITGTADHAQHSLELISGFEKNVFSLAGKTSVREAAALVSVSNMIVGVDTGITHIASCFDIPVVAIFGSTRSVEFRPYSPKAFVIETNTCLCNQLLHLSCEHKTGSISKCMTDVKPEMVIQVIKQFV
ncbi:hypothetical protein GS399_12150 [Pedobacter sp. HMF7647]|uniref:Glycosyltransferase family 9 protein n=1 Tax=Hufsiella arboris TaxID=2695275 RepID=A0A7K1YAV9_9SPHI|nr:glycosyltransferase family 9 protein [Hufsiella arboris]MXV51727.1 hypothetical protein [Hufsiella arboris]